MDTLFQIGNTLALISWIVLLILPKQQQTIAFLKYGVISLLALAYLLLIAQLLKELRPDSFSELSNIKALFQNDQMLVAGWFHYLAFDLLIGIFIVKEGIQSNWKRWQYSICLPFTFMFGPVGLLLFYFIKLLKR